MTASERRAAGESAFCDCDDCAHLARIIVADFANGTYPSPVPPRGYVATILRALVLWSFLSGWGEP